MNEVRLTTGSWATTVGFDQFSKDAINYAYHDILNAEMEWPFLHRSATIETTPGVQFYTLTPIVPAGMNADIKTIDWDSFFITPNETITTINNETQIISSISPYSVSVSGLTSWETDLGVKYTLSSIALDPVTGDPTVGQYTIVQGVYYFNSADAGVSVDVSYTTVTQVSQAVIINAIKLPYIDYDYWRTNYLASDYNALTKNFQQPSYVFKPQTYAEIGFTPVPNAIYNIICEYWLDGLDLVATSDTTLLPDRFSQIIIDGAQKYCFEFREDPQQAGMADARFKAGIARMRIELINRDNTMDTGVHWYRYGYGGYPGPTF